MFWYIHTNSHKCVYNDYYVDCEAFVVSYFSPDEDLIFTLWGPKIEPEQPLPTNSVIPLIPKLTSSIIHTKPTAVDDLQVITPSLTSATPVDTLNPTLIEELSDVEIVEIYNLQLELKLLYTYSLSDLGIFWETLDFWLYRDNLDFYENTDWLNLKLRRNFKNLYNQFCVYQNLVVYKADIDFKKSYGIYGFELFEPSEVINSSNILFKTFCRLANTNFKQYLVNSLSLPKYILAKAVPKYVPIKLKTFSRNRFAIKKIILVNQILEEFKLTFGVDSDEEDSDEEDSDGENLTQKDSDDSDDLDDGLETDDMEILTTIRTNKFFFLQMWEIILAKWQYGKIVGLWYALKTLVELFTRLVENLLEDEDIALILLNDMYRFCRFSQTEVIFTQIISNRIYFPTPAFIYKTSKRKKHKLSLLKLVCPQLTIHIRKLIKVFLTKRSVAEIAIILGRYLCMYLLYIYKNLWKTQRNNFFFFLNRKNLSPMKIRPKKTLFRKYRYIFSKNFKLYTFIYEIFYFVWKYKNISYLIFWIKKLFKNVNFFKHQFLLYFLRFFFKSLTRALYTRFNVNGMFIKFHGKIGKAGNSRKKKFLIRHNFVSTNYTSNYLVEKFQINTFTGVVGCCMIFSFK